MLALRRILYATDRSDCAERAYPHAAFLARAHGAELHALYVRPPGGPSAPDDLLPLSWTDVLDELRLPTEEVPDALPPEAVHRAEIEGDSPAAGILRYAEDHDVDLIVMGTHGRPTPERVLAGSVAERVVREAPCPVLTVRRTKDGSIRRILVPVDFSERGKAVIPTAQALARLYGASIELLYVIDEDALPMAHVPLLGPVRVAPEEVQARFHKLMDHLVQERQGDVPLRGTVLRGHPARDIVAHAEEHADLIVMSTHGRTGLERLFLGSVAEKVVRRAPCPVLTMRSFGARAVGGPAAAAGASGEVAEAGS